MSTILSAMPPRFVTILLCGGLTWAWSATTSGQEAFMDRPVAAFGANGQSGGAAPAVVPGVKNYYAKLFGPQSAASHENPSVLRMASGTAVEGDSARPVPTKPTVQSNPTIQANPTTRKVAPSTTSQTPSARSAANAPPKAVATPSQAVAATPRRKPFPATEPTPAAGEPTQANQDFFPSLPTSPQQPAATQPAPTNHQAAPPSTMAEQAGEPKLSAAPGPSAAPRVDLSSSQAIAGAQVSAPAAVTVAWGKVRQVTLGHQVVCDLLVANHGSGTAHHVVVETQIPTGVKVLAADPKPVRQGNRLAWTFEKFAPGTQRRLALTLLPSREGDLPVAASVHHTESVGTILAVRQPQLQLQINGPSKVPLGEMMIQELTVSNPGTGTAEDIAVEVKLPKGLEHSKGTTFTESIGSLAAGQSRLIRLALYATTGGEKTIQVRVTGSPELSKEAAVRLAVAAPQLALKVQGPSLRFVGRPANYQILVTNQGKAPANNVRIVQVVPSGFRFVSAKQGGTYEPGTREVTWYVGRLKPGENAQFSSTLLPKALGKFEHQVTVRGEGGTPIAKSLTTLVDGTASLVMEVVDLDDPIEVGAQTAYEVRVRNEGTKAASNVAVSCIMPQGVQAISARGPTAYQGNASQFSFAPIAKLAPGKTALYRIFVQGTAPGKHRFRVRLTSESIDEPLVHEELTYYYAD